MRSLVVAVSSFVVLLSACPPPPAPSPTPGPLRAGTATRLIDQPVGIAMGGYLRTRPGSDPGSPWSKQFPASRGVHTEPTARALALTNGVSRVALVRLDTTIVSPTLRSRVRTMLAATGETANVFLYATHTHAGPSRFMPPAHLGDPNGTDFVALVMDHYDVEVELRLTNAIVAAITEAFSALEPVSVGVSKIDASAFNNDRRCENDPIYGHDFRDTDATVIRFDVVDANGAPVRPLTALVHYAMHGTMLGSDNTLQSTEITGGLELYSSDLIGVPIQYLQGAAGDVSPAGSPVGHSQLASIERQGRVVAKLVQQAFVAAAPGNAASAMRLEFFERGVLIDRATMGYAQGEFPESGGLQCAAGGPGPCGAVKSEPKDVICLPLERKRPFRTALSILRLGDDLLLFSLPGEPGTGLTRKMEASLASLGASKTLPIGYAQDHFGYLLEEDDWLRGGYEPTVSAFGWKFGPYLLSEYEQFAATLEQSQTPPDVAPLTELTAPRTITNSLTAPNIVTEPLDGPRNTTHVFVFEGGDPAFGLPRVALQQRVVAEFEPVMASPTRPVINGPELMLRYEATPRFRDDETATTRRHLWTVRFETIPSTPLADYRLVVRGRAKTNGTDASYELVSRAFTVTRSTTSNVTLRVGAGDRLTVEARFPPNPTQYASDIDDVIGNYRVRDDDADPSLGAHLHPAADASFTAPVRLPDQTTSMMTFRWSDTALAWVGDVVTQSGGYEVTLQSNTVSDAHGNNNGALLTLTVTK